MGTRYTKWLCIFGVLLGALTQRPAQALDLENLVCPDIKIPLANIVIKNNLAGDKKILTDIDDFLIDNSYYAICFDVDVVATLFGKPLLIENTTDHPILVDGLAVDLQIPFAGFAIEVTGTSPVVLRNLALPAPLTATDVSSGIEITGDNHCILGSTIVGSKAANSVGVKATDAANLLITDGTTIRSFSTGISLQSNAAPGEQQSIIRDIAVLWDYAADVIPTNGAKGITLDQSNVAIETVTVRGFDIGIESDREETNVKMSTVRGFPDTNNAKKDAPSGEHVDIDLAAERLPGANAGVIQRGDKSSITSSTIEGYGDLSEPALGGALIKLEGRETTVNANTLQKGVIGIEGNNNTAGLDLAPPIFTDVISLFEFDRVGPDDLTDPQFGKICSELNADDLCAYNGTTLSLSKATANLAGGETVNFLAGVLPDDYCNDEVNPQQFLLYEITNEEFDEIIELAVPQSSCEIRRFDEDITLVPLGGNAESDGELVSRDTCGLQCELNLADETLLLKYSNAVHLYAIVDSAPFLLGSFPLSQMPDIISTPGVVTLTPIEAPGTTTPTAVEGGFGAGGAAGGCSLISK